MGTLTAIMTKNLGQQCRIEVQGLIEDLVEECMKLEWASKDKCLQDFFGWFIGKYTWDSLASKLALAPQEAMLWAGFHDGDPRGLNQKALEDFANMADTSIVHPSTVLGKVVRNNNDLLGCRGDPGASTPCFKDVKVMGNNDKGPVANFWTSASLAFVQGMAAKNQSSVVAVLNKGLNETEDWSLYDSVFWNYELPTLQKEIFLNFEFRPQLLLVDMRGTCQKLVGLVTRQLKSPTFYVPIPDRSLLREKPIMCFDCAKGQCDLNAALAAKVRSCLGKDWLSSVRNWFRPPKCPKFP